MNVYFVVLIYATSLFVLSLAYDGPIQKRILKLKNVNYNKTDGKPRTTKKSPKNKTIFVLSNPIVYPQKLFSPKPTTENGIGRATNQFDFLNFDAYILKPRSINYTALLANSNSDVQEKESNKSPEPTTNYPQSEFLDFPRAQPLIQTTVPALLETVSYQTTTQKAKKPKIHHETTTAKISSLFPLGLAYFDSLTKYRKAFDTLQKKERTKKPRTKKTKASSTTTTTTITTTFTPTTTTETEAPFTEIITTREYGYLATPNLDEDLYEEPHFESYRYRPRYHHSYEDETERNRYETTTRYLDYDTLERDDNRYESTESTETTTAKPPNSARRRLPTRNLHSSNVKSNYLYDRYTNYPQESRRVVSVAKLDNRDRRNVRNKSQAVDRRRTDGRGDTRGTEPTEGDRRRTDGRGDTRGSEPTEGDRRRTDGRGDTRGSETTEGGEKRHKNTIPMQRHYFQYANAINEGAYNAGVGKGNQNHYIEQHELSVPKNGTFQKRVRWNDIKGGFGELYYDLNHH